MKYKSFFVAALAGAVALVSLDGLWYAVVMKNYYGAHTVHPDCWRTVPNKIGIVIGQIIMAAVMSYLINVWSSEKPSARKGFLLGAAIGVILYPALGILVHSQIYLIDKWAMLVDLIYGIPAYGLVGMVVGWVSEKMQPEGA